jgi:hypothetical protein
MKKPKLMRRLNGERLPLSRIEIKKISVSLIGSGCVFYQSALFCRPSPFAPFNPRFSVSRVEFSCPSSFEMVSE